MSRKIVKIGSVIIGGDNPIAIQSMLNTPSEDAEKCINQAIQLKNAGCEILRLAIPNFESVKTISKIKEKIDIPLVADIHFDYKLAVESVNAGIDKIRINPGNIGSEDRIKSVAIACREKNIPIRVGANSGSLGLEPTAENLVASALENIKILEKYDFENIVVAIKSTDVATTVKAYEIMAKERDYPLHVGITEAGFGEFGVIKSSIGIGSLILKNLCDTFRVSLTDNPVREIEVAKQILKSLNLHKNGVTLISCPTCGRTKIDIINLARQAEEALKNVNKRLKIAIMGCEVNGPGEAKDADLGIAGGKGSGVIFKKGKIIKTCKEADLLKELLFEVEKFEEI